MRRLYQNITIPGKVLKYESDKRKHSNYWNEGKWNNFIKPLLPRLRENKTFIEIGSSAGMYLKMAEDAGFKHIIGVEASVTRYKEALMYRKSNQGRYKLLNRKVTKDFNFNLLPIANVVLIANTHYYISISDFSKIVDNLRIRCQYCIVVSARVKTKSGCARSDIESVRGYFSDWQEVGAVAGLKFKEDPKPRPDMFGILFKGKLDEYDTKKLYDKSFSRVMNSLKYKEYALSGALDDFYHKLFYDKNFNAKDNKYYEYWKKRRPKRTDEWLDKKIKTRINLGRDIQENGMYEPLYLWKKGLIDGTHRLAIAKALKYKGVLTRRLF